MISCSKCSCAQLSCKLRGFFGQRRGKVPVPGGPLDPAQLAERLGKPFIVHAWAERADAREKLTGTLILVGHGQQRPVCRCGEGRADWAALGELERTLEQVAVDRPRGPGATPGDEAEHPDSALLVGVLLRQSDGLAEEGGTFCRGIEVEPEHRENLAAQTTIDFRLRSRLTK